MIIAMCNLCGSDKVTLVYRKKETAARPAVSKGYSIAESELQMPDKIVRCTVCGLTYAVPETPVADLTLDYENMHDTDYLAEEKGRREQASLVLAKILKHKTSGRLLDVGSGPGFFLDEAKKRGFEAEGVDLSGWASAYAAEHFGIKVHTGDLAGARFADRSFDVVVMNDFIEHVPDPKAMLAEARRILKNDGILYLSTPDINSALSRVLGGRWWGINKYHLYYFSRKTLAGLFQAVGFKPLEYSSYPRVFSLKYWAKRLESYPAFIQAPVEGLKRSRGPESLLKITLHDQIGVIARKVQRLDSLFETEERPSAGSPRKPKVIAVLPAYNAERTLERTVSDIPKGSVDEIILVDDASRDRTVEIAKKLGLTVFEHKDNRGYGGNQKSCYDRALERGADIVVMVHPDYQYDPKIVPQLIEPIAAGRADAVFGSRMMKGGALEGGMPLWKHNANILLTAFENVMLGTYLTEYHSGFRAYSAKLLRTIRYKENSNGFLFDTEIIVQILAAHLRIEELPIRTRYFEEASSIRLGPSIAYGLGIVKTMARYTLHARGLWKSAKYTPAK